MIGIALAIVVTICSASSGTPKCYVAQSPNYDTYGQCIDFVDQRGERKIICGEWEVTIEEER